jgi:hypothetical protein
MTQNYQFYFFKKSQSNLVIELYPELKISIKKNRVGVCQMEFLNQQNMYINIPNGITIRNTKKKKDLIFYYSKIIPLYWTEDYTITFNNIPHIRETEKELKINSNYNNDNNQTEVDEEESHGHWDINVNIL